MVNELSSGSEWINDTDYVGALDMHGILIRAAGEVDDGVGGAIMLRDTNDYCEHEACDCCEVGVTVPDLLAVIDRAGLGPVRTAARELARAIDDRSYRRESDCERVINFDNIAGELRRLEVLL